MNNLSATDIRPQLLSIDLTKAIFQDSLITYNSAGVTYSSATTNYAGSDRVVDPGPSNLEVINP